MSNRSAGPDSGSAFMVTITDPDAGSPVHVPNQRPRRSDSVTLAHTSSMPAVKVRLRTSVRPSSWSVPVGIMRVAPSGWA